MKMVPDHRTRRLRSADPQSSAGFSRRRFLQVTSAAAAGALVIGCSLPSGAELAERAYEDAFVPNAFVRVTSDGRVFLTMPYVEMGQGTYTAIPMLIAEELEVELDQVTLEHAPPNETLYVNPLLGVQATGNSNAVRGSWKPLRQAGAIARTMLIAAAAERWGVDPSDCYAMRGQVFQKSTNQRLGYGELVDEATRMQVPTDVELKRAENFRLIGTRAKRTDAPGKVNGKAVYGIDVRPPGVKIAALAQSPVFGGRL
ncbi:MAG TPA: molybdopterin cofactor-binding domain-containing protein, partial [Nitrospiraceae bacterium]|nr:molybdopterin cofactor-binding domain-containing protein [Nitrospiraceae bacterium]